MKAFLTREFFGIPVYAYAAGLAAIGIGFWYLKGRINTGQASSAPQVNSAAMAPIYPYPQPSTGPVPPTQPFTSPSSSGTPWVVVPGMRGNALANDSWQGGVISAINSQRTGGVLSPQGNFASPPPSPTPSQRAVYPQLVTTRTL